MSEQRIIATYELRSPTGIEGAAHILAGEQSTGTFVALPDESQAIKDRFGSRIESITWIDSASEPEDADEHALVVISLSPDFINGDLTTLLAAVCGNVFELAEVSAIRLVDLDLPSHFLDSCPGPRYGVSGSQDLLGVAGRPLLGAIARPGPAMSDVERSAQVREVLDGGMDFVKDDEVVAERGMDQFASRVRAVMQTVDEHEQRAGAAALYAFNITGSYDTMRERADVVLAAGGRAVQINLAHTGFSAVTSLRRNTPLMIHGHRVGWAAFNRDPDFGIDFGVWQQLWRLAGADHLVVPGLGSRYWQDDAANIAAVGQCLSQIRAESNRDDRALPAIGSKQDGSKLHPTAAAVGSFDWLLLAGSAIFEHPGGPRAGAGAIRAAWDNERQQS